MNAIKNKVQLIGTINVPIIIMTPSNLKVADILVHTIESYRNKDGEKVTESMWHKCRAHGKLADIIDKYTAKGMEVAVEGSLIQTSYTLHGKIIPETLIQITELLILSKMPEPVQTSNA
ncbi:MAG: single-stranded DNA-binding protein [Sediminibacterium sp.]|nr:single-stranded DNA-binding protein [Sediminibacterium sp.]